MPTKRKMRELQINFETQIDFKNVDNMVEDCWLFFKGDDNLKTINKEAFNHEVKAIMSSLKAVMLSEVERLKKTLDDVDFTLAHLEDYTHGEDGKLITEMRKNIQQALKP